MKPVTSPFVLAVEAEAASRLGLFTATSAKAIGLSQALLSYHSHAGGRWLRLLPGVYEIAGQSADPHRTLLAGLLWGGDHAVLSHRAAAWVLNLDGSWSATSEMWAKRGRVPKTVIVHRGVIKEGEVTVTGLLRHTTVVRTVIDLATVVDDDTLELVVESALRKERCEGDLRVAATNGRKGSQRLKRVLARRPVGAPPTESELETRYLQVIRRVDIPPPARQYPVYVDGRCIARLDVCWPEAGMWVELDGRKWHDRPRALLYDRRRQNDLVSRLQWLPLRYTWDDVVDQPMRTARSTAAAYRRRVAGSHAAASLSNGP